MKSLKIASNLGSMSRGEYAVYGTSIVKSFCKLNNIDFPIVEIEDRSIFNDRAGHYIPGSETINIFLTGCKTPHKIPYRQWSFPHYKVDKTPVGVVCHEFSHYMQEYLKIPSHSIGRNMSPHRRITSYEPNPNEVFAESCRLFILNSDLLRIVSPKRYKFLAEELKLKPVIFDRWDIVLKQAHGKIHNAVRNQYII